MSRIAGAILVLSSVILFGLTMVTAALSGPTSGTNLPSQGIFSLFQPEVLAELSAFVSIPLAGYIFVQGIMLIKGADDT